MVIITHEMEIARNISTRVFYMDEGFIYEEVRHSKFLRTPEEKNQEFINRVRRYTYRITSKDYDLYAMNAEIEAFCETPLIQKDMSQCPAPGRRSTGAAEGFLGHYPVPGLLRKRRQVGIYL